MDTTSIELLRAFKSSQFAEQVTPLQETYPNLSGQGGRGRPPTAPQAQ